MYMQKWYKHESLPPKKDFELIFLVILPWFTIWFMYVYNNACYVLPFIWGDEQLYFQIHF